MTDPVLVPFDFDGPGVRAVVSTRLGGVSAGAYAGLNLGDHVGDDPAAVRHNRDLLARALGVPRLTIADQQHGATVAVVTAADAGRGHSGAADAAAAFPATDALVTDVPGVALTVLVADCTPVLLWDPVRRVAGAVHCGRPGTIAGVLPATVAVLAATYGSDPADLVAGVGPGICRTSYEVTDTEAAAMEEAFEGLGFTEPTRPGHHLLDVPAAVAHQLAAAGVATVHTLGVDTRTDTARFYSHRAVRPCGRFAAVIVIGEAPTTPRRG